MFVFVILRPPRSTRTYTLVPSPPRFLSVGGAVLPPGSGDGGARGAPPRSNVSTMIMRPLQQGHGGRWSAAAPASTAAAACSGGSIGGSDAAMRSLARAMLASQIGRAHV